MSIHRPVFARRARIAGAWALALLVSGAPAALATSYTWNNIAGGYAADAGNWSPNGVPGALDDVNFNLFSNYPVVWASPQDTLQSLTVVNSQPAFTINGSLGVRFHPLLENNATFIVYGGRISGPSWSMIENNANAAMALTGPTTQALALASSTTSLFGSKGGTAGLSINNGALFQSAGEISFAPNGTTMTVQIGQSGGQRATLATTTSGVPGRGWIAVGDYGVATLALDIGGKLNPAGDLFVGRHLSSSGQVQLQSGPSQVPLVDARGQVFIGANDEASAPGGQAVVDVQAGTFSSLGRCWLGDPDDYPLADSLNPSSRMLVEGGNVVLAGGLTMSAIRSARLELRGGRTHVIGGTVSLIQSTPFEIGVSAGANPVLFLENGTTTDISPIDASHPALGIGRGGMGTLDLAGAGTTLTVHGGLVMADSVGGNAVLNADSASTVIVQGKTAVGSHGNTQIVTRGAGTTVTMQDSVAIGTGGAEYANLIATNSATMHFQKPVALGGFSYGDMYVNNGAQVDAPGFTIGPTHGGLFIGFGGAKVATSDRLDLIGNGFLEVDVGGTLVYTGGTRAATVGAGNATLIVSDSSLAQITPELDVRGLLYLEPSQTSGLVSASPGARNARPARTQVSYYAVGGRLECPLTRILDTGKATIIGAIAGRFHVDSGTGTLQVSYDGALSASHATIGDSTKTDGFVSIGTTKIGLDTLK
ncbi:MAG: hypothetical protein ACHQ52_11300, partial [Candidatus Eisenbacteria bacterium]